MTRDEAREAAAEKAAKEIFRKHPDVPCWVPAEHGDTFTRTFAYIARLGFDAGYEAREDVASALRELVEVAKDGTHTDIAVAISNAERLLKGGR